METFTSELLLVGVGASLYLISALLQCLTSSNARQRRTPLIRQFSLLLRTLTKKDLFAMQTMSLGEHRGRA